MKLFYKPLTLNWWQISLMKLSLVSLGIVVGVYFQDFFGEYILLLSFLFLISGLYLVYVWLKQ